MTHTYSIGTHDQALDAFQVEYFITQVALAGASFGVAPSDLEIIGHALSSLFEVRCSPPTAVVPGAPKESQGKEVDDPGG